MESFIRLGVTVGIVLVYRWSLHLSTPAKDYRLLSDLVDELGVHVRRGITMMRVWLMSLITYVPSSTVQDAWVMLRDRFAAGRYGEAGT
jgi:hypothetical protein